MQCEIVEPIGPHVPSMSLAQLHDLCSLDRELDHDRDLLLVQTFYLFPLFCSKIDFFFFSNKKLRIVKWVHEKYFIWLFNVIILVLWK